jgi:hypothetical protein
MMKSLKQILLSTMNRPQTACVRLTEGWGIGVG